MKIHFRIYSLARSMWKWVCLKFELFKLTLQTLCYNEFTSSSTVLEAAMAPLFCMVDRFSRVLGLILTTVVVLLTTLVLIVFYTCIVPYVFYQTDYFWTFVHAVFAHYLMANIIFHYIMAGFTSPGWPPRVSPEAVTTCKKCVAPKPSRAHHCSVCRCCVLKMDHHCLWLNNCVGHYNHRYFFSFCVYMWLGSTYVACAGRDVFLQHFIGRRKFVIPAFFSPLKAAYYFLTKSTHGVLRSKDVVGADFSYRNMPFHNLVAFQYVMCVGVSVALGILTLWHMRLISRGETSIEARINANQRKKFKSCGMTYMNVFDFGCLHNWKRFFGLNRTRTFWRHVLLPSWHRPDVDGLTWEMSGRLCYEHQIV